MLFVSEKKNIMARMDIFIIASITRKLLTIETREREEIWLI